MEALILHIFIHKKAFRSCNAATQELYKVFMMDVTNQIDLIKEVIYPLSCIE